MEKYVFLIWAWTVPLKPNHVSKLLSRKQTKKTKQSLWSALCEWMSVSSVYSPLYLIKLVWLMFFFCLLLASALLLLFHWPSTSAFVKLPPCVYCSSVTHGVALNFKPARARKNRNQRKHGFCCLNGKVPQEENQNPGFFYVSTVCTNFRGFKMFSISTFSS